jgi:hypothetical protein
VQKIDRALVIFVAWYRVPDMVGSVVIFGNKFRVNLKRGWLRCSRVVRFLIVRWFRGLRVKLWCMVSLEEVRVRLALFVDFHLL